MGTAPHQCWVQGIFIIVREFSRENTRGQVKISKIFEKRIDALNTCDICK
jgi:hypothetical protein